MVKTYILACDRNYKIMFTEIVANNLLSQLAAEVTCDSASVLVMDQYNPIQVSPTRKGNLVFITKDLFT